MDKVIYVRTVETKNRTSGYALLLDINNGYGTRYTSFGSWAVMLQWISDNVGDNCRVFVSGR